MSTERNKSWVSFRIFNYFFRQRSAVFTQAKPSGPDLGLESLINTARISIKMFQKSESNRYVNLTKAFRHSSLKEIGNGSSFSKVEKIDIIQKGLNSKC